MLILACDTSTEYAVFALGTEAGKLIAGQSVQHNRDLSRRFYDLLDGVLAQAGVGFKDIDVLAAGVGPGSFTGVRVAVTTFKSLSLVSKKKLIAVGTPAIYAADTSLPPAAHRVIVLPSRRGEVYCQVFEEDGVAGAPAALSYQALEDLLASLGPGTLVCGQTHCLPEPFGGAHLYCQTAPPAHAFIEASAQQVRDGAWADPIGLSPTYAALPAISQHKNR